MGESEGSRPGWGLQGLKAEGESFGKLEMLTEVWVSYLWSTPYKLPF